MRAASWFARPLDYENESRLSWFRKVIDNFPPMSLDPKVYDRTTARRRDVFEELKPCRIFKPKQKTSQEQGTSADLQ